MKGDEIMQKGMTSRRNQIQDLLCPFIYVKITQGANGNYSHKGTMACDIGYKFDKNEAYYAPCDIKCVWIYPSSGQSMWQSLEKVRFANGIIDYFTFVIAHDNSFNAKVNQIVRQGEKLGNKGNKGNATGYHCHIEGARGKYTVENWKKNQYGIYMLPNEIDFDALFFMDQTEIQDTNESKNANWIYLKDVTVSETTQSKKLYLPETVSKWRVYPTNVPPVVGNEKGYLNPAKFHGLEYDIIAYPQKDVVTIETRDFGIVNIFVASTTGAVIK